jgi:TM2 domain-containing membrane protein YozV
MGPGCVVFFEKWHWQKTGVTVMFACWAIAAGLITYFIARSIQNKNNTLPFPDEQATFSNNSIPFQQSEISSKRIAAGILAILLGVFGVHKFYLGMTGAGIIVLLAAFLSFSILMPVTAVIGLIEGVIYLTKSDREFYRDYVVQKRAWF